MNLRKLVKRLVPPSYLRRRRIAWLDKQLSDLSVEGWRSALTTRSTQPGVLTKLVEGVGYCFGAGVVGHVAEFGTGSGRTSTILAHALAFFSEDARKSDELHGIGERKLYLFDSFKGLPSASVDVDRESPQVSSGIWSPGSCFGIPQSDLLAMCGRFLPKERIVVCDGWFRDTMPLLGQQKLALVHIDCDLYESTLQVLEYLLSNNSLSDGCMILFDDWNCNRASPQYGERRAWSECVQKYGLRYSDCGDYSIFGHKVIVHQYT